MELLVVATDLLVGRLLMVLVMGLGEEHHMGLAMAKELAMHRMLVVVLVMGLLVVVLAKGLAMHRMLEEEQVMRLGHRMLAMHRREKLLQIMKEKRKHCVRKLRRILTDIQFYRTYEIKYLHAHGGGNAVGNGMVCPPSLGRVCEYFSS